MKVDTALDQSALLAPCFLEFLKFSLVNSYRSDFSASVLRDTNYFRFLCCQVCLSRLSAYVCPCPHVHKIFLAY